MKRTSESERGKKRQGQEPDTAKYDKGKDMGARMERAKTTPNQTKRDNNSE